MCQSRRKGTHYRFEISKICRYKYVRGNWKNPYCLDMVKFESGITKNRTGTALIWQVKAHLWPLKFQESAWHAGAANNRIEHANGTGFCPKQMFEIVSMVADKTHFAAESTPWSSTSTNDTGYAFSCEWKHVPPLPDLFGNTTPFQTLNHGGCEMKAKMVFDNYFFLCLFVSKPQSQQCIIIKYCKYIVTRSSLFVCGHFWLLRLYGNYMEFCRKYIETI